MPDSDPHVGIGTPIGAGPSLAGPCRRIPITLLPLARYAELMAIPGWTFFQVDHTARESRGVCSEPLLQSGYYGDPNIPIGRNEIAQAVQTAEQQLARVLGYWPAPMWICQEEHEWPIPKRGTQTTIPTFELDWGQFIEGGVETYDLVASANVAYSDEDNDGVSDWATVTVASLYEPLLEDECEIVITPTGYEPQDGWIIRPVCTEINDDDTITIEGYRWLFVIPAYWTDNIEAIPLDDDTYFCDSVDVYHHYNDPSHQARILWKGKDLETGLDLACGFVSQNACIRSHNCRNGLVLPVPGTYIDGDDVWRRDNMAYCDAPTHARFWYKAGYDDDACLDCTNMGPKLQEAIVRLANVYLANTPCGCDHTQDKWESDREELDVVSFAIALAQRRLGTTARGAVFAMSVASSMESLGKGG